MTGTGVCDPLERRKVERSTNEVCIEFLEAMAESLVFAPLISAGLQVLFDRLSPRDVYGLFKSRKLDEQLLERLERSPLAANAVLAQAELKQLTDPTVRKCLDQLRDAVYDAEDMLDQIATKALKSKLKAQCKKSIFKVGKSISSRSIAAFEAQLRKVLDKLEFFVDQKDALGLSIELGTMTITNKPTQNDPTSSFIGELGNVYVQREEKEAIIELLQSELQKERVPDVIAVVGMGGIGKTTLSQLVFNDPKVAETFELKAWVCVSEQFDIVRLTETTLGEVSSGEYRRGHLNELQLQLKQRLARKRFLVILDDVWNEDSVQWNAFLAPFRYAAVGSKIIATTRNITVATAMQTGSLHHLQKLTEEESWSLFMKHAYNECNSEAWPGLEPIGRQIVKKCDGLPLALKTVGCLLRSEHDLRKWELMSRNGIWNMPHGNPKVLPVLLLSYHYLPPLVKRCFAYCSIFPKNIEFQKEQLILLWSAEGILEQPNNGMSMEEVGEECFDVLVSRCLLERSGENNSCFKMHDLVNDLAKFIAGESFFCLDGGNSHDASHRTRHASYIKTYTDVSSKFKALNEASRLRTLLGVDPKSSYSYGSLTNELLDHLVPSMRYLRVLSLSGYSSIWKLPKSLGGLQYLRYLNLSFTGIKMLPDSITTLCNLQSLLLVNCKDLEELPCNMGRLINLRHLDTRLTPLRSTPTGMGKLKNLQTLTHFILAKDGGSNINELGELRHLRGFLSVEGLDNVCTAGDARLADLERKRNLSSLMLKWSSETRPVQPSEINVLEKLRPPSNLEALTIRSYCGPRFPDWLASDHLINISVLNIEDCKHCTSLPPLGQFRSLQKLLIRGLDKIVTVGSELYGTHPEVFPSLQYLEFGNMKSLQEWASAEGPREGNAFPLLQKLKIINCPELRGALPSNLPLLSELSIEECPLLEAAMLQVPHLCKLRLINKDKVSGPDRSPSNTCRMEIQCSSITDGLSIPLRCFPTSMTTLSVTSAPHLDLLTERCHESLQDCYIDSCEWLRSFPLHLFPSVKQLTLFDNKNLESLSLSESSPPLHLNSLSIWGSPNLASFPRRLHAPFLTSLELCNCTGLKSLPEDMSTVLPSLRALVLDNCLEIEGFPNGGLPPKLVDLEIRNCNNLTDLWEEWGLQSLHSLEYFHLAAKNEDMKPFPKDGMLPASFIALWVEGFKDIKCLNIEALEKLTSLQQLCFSDTSFGRFLAEPRVLTLPSTLTTLKLSNLEMLMSLEDIGIQNLTCLQHLYVHYCSVKSLPAMGLPKSLLVLLIGGCPQLGRLLRSKKGREWSKVSHIPRIEIDGDLLT